MQEIQAPRSPKQARSIQTKEKILAAAYRLFCSKGYHNTTTNAIAKEAGVPIGSVYAYFKDKDTVFMEILERYHAEFTQASAALFTGLDAYQSDVRAWLRQLIENLIDIRVKSRELNREMQCLCFSNPRVEAFVKLQRKGLADATLSFLRSRQGRMNVADIEAAALVVFDTVVAIVDRIALGDYEIERPRIVNACVEEIYRYLLG